MQSEAKAKALEQFTDYFVRNYPGPDTIIYDPKWHAPKIFAAAYSAISAALSDKQAGEVKVLTPEQYMAVQDAAIAAYEGSTASSHRYSAVALRRAVDAAFVARSALVDVPAVEPVSNDLIGYVLRYGGTCRDCADMDGVCQSGQPCDTEQRRAVVKHTISALAYGIKHGFIANPFTSPPLREGEDSAEVVTLTRAEADRLAQRLEFDASWDKCGDGYYSIKRQLGALAATRSGSATSAKGISDE